jgi:hypothetical protein
MFPISNEFVVATVRSAALVAWAWFLGWLLSLEAVAGIEGIGDFLASVGDFISGPGVVFAGALIYAAIYKLAQLDNVVGMVIRYAFVFPAQPSYDLPA